jgi:hypothetical protein
MPVPSSLVQSSTPDNASLAAMMAAADPRHMAATARLAVAPNVEFFLRHHPAQWEPEATGLDGNTWLPVIGMLPLVPGAHLVRTRKNSEDPVETFKNAIKTDETKGWVHIEPNAPIPAECLPAGVPAGGYLRQVPCKDPRSNAVGTYYLEAWNVPRAHIPGTKQRFVFDRAAYNRWRLWLVTSGAIQPPTEDVLRELIAARSGRPDRIAALPLPDDLRKSRVAAAEAAVDGMTKAAIPGAKATKRKEAAA